MTSSELVVMLAEGAYPVEDDPPAYPWIDSIELAYDVFPELWELPNGTFFSEATRHGAKHLKGWLDTETPFEVIPYVNGRAAYVRKSDA